MPAPLRPRVLLVDDHDPLLTVLCEVLDRAGFEVSSASTATEAMDLLSGRRYAAIVADCSLPDLAPLDWLAALRGAASGTPFILQSGGIEPEELAGHAVEFRAAAVEAVQRGAAPGRRAGRPWGRDDGPIAPAAEKARDPRCQGTNHLAVAN